MQCGWTSFYYIQIKSLGTECKLLQICRNDTMLIVEEKLTTDYCQSFVIKYLYVFQLKTTSKDVNLHKYIVAPNIAI